MTAEPTRDELARVAGRLIDWTAEAAASWGAAPIRLRHRLAETGYFTDESLAEIIDHYPVESYSLISMGAFSRERKWRIGRVEGLSGAELIDVIRNNPLWLNLRGIEKIDSRFGRLFEAFIAELNEDVPGLGAVASSMGVLISGPSTHVDYHADLPGQSLWQIRGEKTVYVYPNTPPYITERQLEDIVYDRIEKIPYDPRYDDEATVLPLAPGEMLHWPLNAPHRVDNGPMLNVSVTTEYMTPQIKRLNQMSLANAILRRRLKMPASGRPTEGMRYKAKAALQGGFSRAGLLDSHRTRVQPLSFSLSKGHDGAVRMDDL
jgi:hypothetical protein